MTQAKAIDGARLAKINCIPGSNTLAHLSPSAASVVSAANAARVRPVHIRSRLTA
jgi:hypothetical protein